MEDFESRLLGLALFTLVSSITPGPNNTLLLSSGRHLGYRKTLPLMAGIFTGFIVLLTLSGFGVAGLMQGHPLFALILRCVSSVWLAYLAYLIFRMNTAPSQTTARFIGFREAFFMQFVNPKAWAVALNGAGGFLPRTGSVWADVGIYAGFFLGAGIIAMNVWTLAGAGLARLLKSERANFVLAAVLSLLMLSSIVTLWM